jgi:hypothetical protein
VTRRERNARRRLAYHLEKARKACVGRPMVWGKDDCALWHADIQLAAMGVDVAAPYRGRYKTRRGAHRVLGALGLPMALQRLTRKHRCNRVDPKRARIGDVGVIEVGKAFACVRLLHKGEWIGRNEFGWSMVPTDRVRAAWSAV